MSSANRDELVFLFQTMPLNFFFLAPLHWLGPPSGTLVNRCDVRGHLYFVLNHSIKYFAIKHDVSCKFFIDNLLD